MTSPSKAAADGPYKDGGPAFPISLPGWGDNGASGMTLRDYFAAQALVGMMSTTAHPQSTGVEMMKPGEWAGAAYELANAMLAERPKW